MAICTRCNNNVSFWAGGADKQTGLFHAGKLQKDQSMEVPISIQDFILSPSDKEAEFAKVEPTAREGSTCRQRKATTMNA